MYFSDQQQFYVLMDRCQQECNSNFERYNRIKAVLDQYPDNVLMHYMSTPDQSSKRGSPWPISISFTIDTKERLTEILRSLRSVLSAPLKYVAPQEKSGDPYWEQDGLVVNTYLYFKQCRKVQVGTKEVPVYEVICDDYSTGEENPE